MILRGAWARELKCEYGSYNYWVYWTSYKECSLSRVDLSQDFKSEAHSFTGSLSQKSEVTLVEIRESYYVEFIPTELTQQFPNLNALVFWESDLPVVMNDLLGPSLKNIQFLNFFKSNVESVESEAFSSLVNLKYILFYENPLKALNFPLFRNNLKLEIIRFYDNKIKMFNPSLFDGLTNLKIVHFSPNDGCVTKEFGCPTCEISFPDLKAGLATCFSNCEEDLECNKKTSPKQK
jgi:hypothetical protein